jgi:hypothetical protein
MNSVKLLGFLLLSVVFVSAAMAADKATSAAASDQPRLSIAQTDSGAVSLAAPSYESVIAQLDRTKHVDRRVNLNPLAGVCFTMRSYKVKRTERFRDDESAATAYSTCQVGLGYTVRSVDGATLK